MIRWIARSYNGRSLHAYDTDDVVTEVTHRYTRRVPVEILPDHTVRYDWREITETVSVPPSLVSFCKQANRINPAELRDPATATVKGTIHALGYREVFNPDPMTQRNLCARCFKRAVERGIFK